MKENLSDIMTDEQINSLIDEVENGFYQIRDLSRNWTELSFDLITFLDGLTFNKKSLNEIEIKEIRKRIENINSIKNNILAIYNKE